MSQKLLCFLCHEEETDNRPVKQFSEKDFQKCKKALTIKKAFNFEFSDVNLPLELSDSIGYHAGCFKKFTFSKLYCFVCGKKPRKKTITKLDEKKFSTCKEILSIRKANNLAYGDLILPDELTDSEGYHSGCYSNFTALAKKYKEKQAEKDT